MGQSRGQYRALMGKPLERKLLGRPKSKCQDNIRMDLRKVGRGTIDCINVPQDRDRWGALVNAVMNLRVP